MAETEGRVFYEKYEPTRIAMRESGGRGMVWVEGGYPDPPVALAALLWMMREQGKTQGVINHKTDDGEYLEVIHVTRYKKRIPFNWSWLNPLNWRRRKACRPEETFCRPQPPQSAAQ